MRTLPWYLAALWLAVNLAVVLGLHVYLWRRLVKNPALPPPWNRFATLTLGLLALSLPAALALRFTGPAVPRAVVLPAYLWMALGLYLVLGLFWVDLGRWALRTWHRAGRGLGRRWAGRFESGWMSRLLARLGVGGEPELPDPQRRQWLSRMVAGGAMLSAGGLGTLAVNGALGGPKVERVKVRLPKLHPSLRGFRIAQISDLHIGQLIDRNYVEAVVGRVNELEPHLVAITGDLVDGTPERLGAAAAPLAQLRSPWGTYFVTGNHEYYSGAEAWLEHLPTLGIRVLQNERVQIGTDEASFDLAGVNDVSARRIAPQHATDYNRALAGRDPARPVVLLAHQPKAIFEAAARGVDLLLSGHTHGGQVWPFTWLAHLIFPYVRGLHRHGDTQIYVNRGTGFVGPPARLDSAAELTLIELT